MLGSGLPQHLNIRALLGEVRNEVSKQGCDEGQHPWAPISPSLHTAHSSPADGSARPHYTQLGLRKDPRGLPTLAQIRGGDSARYFTAVWNIWAGDQRETVTEGYTALRLLLSVNMLWFSSIIGPTFSSGTL